jgi:hypothetical protein
MFLLYDFDADAFYNFFSILRIKNREEGLVIFLASFLLEYTADPYILEYINVGSSHGRMRG